MRRPHTPSPESVLRALFWKLLFRGRTAQQAQTNPRRQWGLLAIMIAYALFGLVPAVAAFKMAALPFASMLHAFTFLFASLTLASSAGTMLFVREEAEILLHRPIRAEQLLRAKVFVLVAYALLLALALNAAGLVTSLWTRGANWAFVPAHLLVTVLLMVFSASLIVLVYNVCLRWFGRERFDNLLTLVQTLLTIIMITGSQLMPRLLSAESLDQIDVSRGLALALPPVWFGALDVLMSGAAPAHAVWLPAGIGIAATALVAWLAFVRLGSSYGIGLMALHENAAPGPDVQRRRVLQRLLQRPPLRWWLRDPIERHAFLLVSAYIVRDRQTKLKLYPSLAPLMVMPIVLVLGPGHSGAGGPGMAMDAIAIAYAAIVPVQAMMLLHRSEQWRAAVVFRMTPLVHWTPVFHGARKAVLAWLAYPALLGVGGLLAALHGSWSPLGAILPMFLIMTVGSLVPGLFHVWLPLSKPNEDQRGASMGCIVFAAVLIPAMSLQVLVAAMEHHGRFWPCLAGIFVLGLLLQRWLVGRMARRSWQPVDDAA